MTRKKVLIIVSIVVVLAAVVGANLYFRRETGVSVNTEAVRARDLEAIVSASGRVQPKRQVNVSASGSRRASFSWRSIRGRSTPSCSAAKPASPPPSLRSSSPAPRSRRPGPCSIWRGRT
jgi:hypothetical protein